MLTSANILVCSDFTQGSDLAMRAGETLREKSRGPLHVLHVNEYPLHWESPMKEIMSKRMDEKFELELLGESEKKLRAQMTAKHLQGEAHVRIGIPFHEILSFVQEKNIGIIVMGHKGKGGTPFYLGGLANKIISSTPVPVLIVKKEFCPVRIAGLVDPNEPLEEIVSVTEEMAELLSCPSEFISLIVDVGARYAGIGKLGFSTKLLSLSEEDRGNVKKIIKDQISKTLRSGSKAQIKVEVSVEKKLAYHLNAVLSSDFSDLVVMKRHHSGFLEKILIGSETRRMIELFDGNIIVLPP